MSPITPKSERDHALVKEIEMLRDERIRFVDEIQEKIRRKVKKRKPSFNDYFLDTDLTLKRKDKQSDKLKEQIIGILEIAKFGDRI